VKMISGIDSCGRIWRKKKRFQMVLHPPFEAQKKLAESKL